MGKQIPIHMAAEVLGISQSTLRRRIHVLDLEPGPVVDPEEVQKAWAARRQSARSRASKTSSVNAVVGPEEREEFDTIAERHGYSLGETIRRLLRLGLIGYYSNGRDL